MRRSIYRAVGIIRTLVYQKRTLKLDLAAEAAAIALAALVCLVSINDVVRENIGKEMPSQGSPGVY